MSIIDVNRYNAVAGEGLHIKPSGMNGNNLGLVFEVQPRGFGIEWPTSLAAKEAVVKVLDLLPVSPGSKDESLIVVEDDNKLELPTIELVERVAALNGIVFVHASIGGHTVTWLSATSNSERSTNELGLGGDHFEKEIVTQVLGATVLEAYQGIVQLSVDEAAKALAG